MRAGGGKAKGSAFEREVGNSLSMWISNGQRINLFARTVLSGGQFSNAVKKGDAETGTPGDLMANHPLAFEFMSLFNIECKHHADLGFELFLFNQAKSFLGKVFALTQLQCGKARPELFPFVVAKQNRRPPILLVDYGTGYAFLGATSARLEPIYHELHSGEIMMFDFERIMAISKPAVFIKTMIERRLIA